MKRNKIALALLLLSFVLWVFQLYELSDEVVSTSHIISSVQFLLMIAFYFAIKKENK